MTGRPFDWQARLEDWDLPPAQARRLAREWRQRVAGLQRSGCTRGLAESIADAWPWYQAHLMYALQDDQWDSRATRIMRTEYGRILTTTRMLDRKVAAFRETNPGDSFRWMENLRAALDDARRRIESDPAFGDQRRGHSDDVKRRAVAGIGRLLVEAGAKPGREGFTEILEVVFGQRAASGLTRQYFATSDEARRLLRRCSQTSTKKRKV